MGRFCKNNLMKRDENESALGMGSIREGSPDDTSLIPSQIRIKSTVHDFLVSGFRQGLCTP